MSTKKFTARHGIDANYQDIVSANNVSTNTLTALVSTGTAPLSISSTTKVDNLNVDLLDSYHASISNTANTIVVRDANTFISLNGIYMNSSEGLKRIAWNDTYSTYDMQLLDGVTLQVGQESHVYGRATENIQNGQVVMFAGAQGDGLLLRVANTQISGFEPRWIVGVATQTIPQNDWGYVTWFGKVNDVDTYNYSLGDILYLNNSVAGGLSNTRPTAPNYAVSLAAVVRKSNSPTSNNGILMVRPDFGASLSELHDVNINGISNNNVLIYSSVNNRWENKTQADITSGDSDKLDGQHGSYYTGYTDTANTNNLIYTNNAISSNVNLLAGVDVTQNTNISNLTSWLNSNNTLQANINSTQNTNITTVTTAAQAAFIHANSAFNNSNTKFNSSGGTISGDVVVTGNVTVQGVTTTLDVDTLVVKDKNVVLANVASPTDVTADGAGLTVLGTTNKTWNWVDATDSWTSSENVNLLTGKTYKINGTDVLSATTLGSGVTSSSLTSVGTLSSLSVSGNVTLGDAFGDTLTINAGTTTFAQGTANGVLYLNGSKVATSRSALTFDGKLFSFVGDGIYPIISIAPTGNNAIFGYRLDAAAGNGRDWRLEQGRSAVGELNFSDLTSNAIRYAIASDGTSIWNVGAGNGSERMRLTAKGLLVGYTSDSGLSGTGNAIFSGNVGIGTSSPTTTVYVAAASGDSVVTVGNAGVSGNHRVSVLGGGVGTSFGYYLNGNPALVAVTGSGTQLRLGSDATSTQYQTISLYTNATERLRIDSAGTLILRQSSNAANTSVSFNTTVQNALTLDASGNLGIGTSSPTSKLHINDGAVFFNRISSTESGLKIGEQDSVPVANAKHNIIRTIGVLSESLFIAAGKTPAGSNGYISFGTAETERMRINPTGFISMSANVASTNTTTGTLVVTGGVGISGALNATTKSFDIVHPSDPTKRLRYGSLESPSHSVRLTGKGSVYKGTGIIRLPEYFKDLVRKEEINIQLTNIRHGEILWVEEEKIEENYFVVGCNSEEDLEFYWSLTAERADTPKLVVEYPI